MPNISADSCRAWPELSYSTLITHFHPANRKIFKFEPRHWWTFTVLSLYFQCVLPMRALVKSHIQKSLGGTPQRIFQFPLGDPNHWVSRGCGYKIPHHAPLLTFFFFKIYFSLIGNQKQQVLPMRVSVKSATQKSLGGTPLRIFRRPLGDPNHYMSRGCGRDIPRHAWVLKKNRPFRLLK